MDETDLRLIHLLLANSRTPYSVLARRLKVSVPAVHKRVTSLHESGFVSKFTANLSIPFLRAVPCYIWGTSEAFPLRRAVEDLGKSDLTVFAITGSGSMLHIYALLPTIEDLAPYVVLLQKAASMPSPQVGLVASAVFGRNPSFPTAYQATELDRLDFRILLEIHDNARTSIADVCDAVRASPKTVRNRLRRMVERGVVEFSIEAQPGVHAAVNAFLPIQLRPGTDVGGLRNRMVSDLDPWIVWAATFSNMPNTMAIMTATTTSEAHEALVNRISSYEGVEKLAVHVISHYDYFRTWRGALLRRKAAARDDARPA